MRLMDFDSGSSALAQLCYGFTPSAYEGSNENHRYEQPVADLYVWLTWQVLQLHGNRTMSELEGK